MSKRFPLREGVQGIVRAKEIGAGTIGRMDRVGGAGRNSFWLWATCATDTHAKGSVRDGKPFDCTGDSFDSAF